MRSDAEYDRDAVLNQVLRDLDKVVYHQPRAVRLVGGPELFKARLCYVDDGSEVMPQVVWHPIKIDCDFPNIPKLLVEIELSEAAMSFPKLREDAIKP